MPSSPPHETANVRIGLVGEGGGCQSADGNLWDLHQQEDWALKGTHSQTVDFFQVPSVQPVAGFSRWNMCHQEAWRHGIVQIVSGKSIIGDNGPAHNDHHLRFELHILWFTVQWAHNYHHIYVASEIYCSLGIWMNLYWCQLYASKVFLAFGIGIAFNQTRCWFFFYC